MDEMFFTDAESNVNDLVWEYGSIHQMCREEVQEPPDEPPNEIEISTKGVLNAEKEVYVYCHIVIRII